MATASAPDRPDYFKNSVIVLLTLISVFTALVTFLQNRAALISADLAQRSSLNAVDATGLEFEAGLAASRGTEGYQAHALLREKALAADTIAKGLRMGGKVELAADYDKDAERWQLAADELRSQDPVIDAYAEDADLYQEELKREAYVLEERQHTLASQARAYSDKANAYVGVISTLSVALFLGGLSLTLGSRLRYLLALAAGLLAFFSSLWVIVIGIQPVPVISEAAIQAFVDGRILYNTSSDDVPDQQAAAIAAFDDAIGAADGYARAYFYRSLANTDSSIIDRPHDTQRAIDDGLRALALGYDRGPMLGSLGWAYYLNGQYRLALDYTRQAIAASPNVCYWPFNHGLILTALGQPEAAYDAYTGAILCAQVQNSDTYFDYFLDVGVVDLQDLRDARPDLEASIEPAIVRLKDAYATLNMYGSLDDMVEVEAQFEPVVFGNAVDDDDVVMNVRDHFPQATTVLYASLVFEGMQPGDRWMSRWLLDGYENSVAVYDTWEYNEAGAIWVNLYNPAGLNAGTHELDVFVNGRLVARGEVVIERSGLPPMTYQTSETVGTTLSYPDTWNFTSLTNPEVFVAAARDPERPSFIGVTAWSPDDSTDQAIFDLFDTYLDDLTTNTEGFSQETREPFTVAGRNGWRNDYAYTNTAGEPVLGAVAGVWNAAGDTVYMVVLEAHADDWGGLQPVFDVMLERLTIE